MLVNVSLNDKSLGKLAIAYAKRCNPKTIDVKLESCNQRCLICKSIFKLLHINVTSIKLELHFLQKVLK
jgi:hypothetical protein